MKRNEPQSLRRALHALTFVMLAALGSATNAQLAPDLNEVLVENRWTKVTRGDYEAELLRIPADIRGGFATDKKRVTDLLVRMLVGKSLAIQARAGELYKDPEMQRRRALEIDRIDASLFVAQVEESAAREFDARKAQFEARARELYAVRGDKYRVPEQVDASHILFSFGSHDRAEAQKLAIQARAKLVAGADFVTLAKEVSEDQSVLQNAGHTGYFDKGKMDAKFTDAAFALKNVGDLSEPVASSFGYHIIRLDGRIASRPRSFEEVLPEMLAEERKTYVSNAREAALSAIRNDPLSKMNQAAVDALVIKVDPERLRKANEQVTPPK
jgi:peptidyl-prolyl cis-trans isomerase C